MSYTGSEEALNEKREGVGSGRRGGREATAHSASASHMSVSYAVLAADHGVLSLRFSTFQDFPGTVHPSHGVEVFNYSLREARALKLEDLFTPGSAYLKTLADYCIEELQLEDEWRKGAEPKRDNYTRWNLTRDGLLITFDEYQVAPYAAGIPEVAIPYGELSAMLRKERSCRAVRESLNMKSLEEPDQRAYFSTTDHDPVDVSTAVRAFETHAWQAELSLQSELERGGLEHCSPGIGFVDPDGPFLHVCPSGDGLATVHYTPKPTRFRFLWPARPAIVTREGVPRAEVVELIRRFLCRAARFAFRKGGLIEDCGTLYRLGSRDAAAQ